jgi:hypothetical protein
MNDALKNSLHYVKRVCLATAVEGTCHVFILSASGTTAVAQTVEVQEWLLLTTLFACTQGNRCKALGNISQENLDTGARLHCLETNSGLPIQPQARSQQCSHVRAESRKPCHWTITTQLFWGRAGRESTSPETEAPGGCWLCQTPRSLRTWHNRMRTSENTLFLGSVMLAISARQQSCTGAGRAAYDSLAIEIYRNTWVVTCTCQGLTYGITFILGSSSI